ncbi:MAG TPA: hypothetical protein VKT49_23200 [Bryobacteraceae bacterium]|nr:hypothetical protein [Bryobacteraceae bacterium]
MTMRGLKQVVVLTAVVLAVALGAWAQDLPLSPFHNSGQSVTGAFEGWFQNPDGTYSILVGYYNRNQQEPLDIPIGPDNRIEPGGPDRGQPTHFLPGRQWGLFTVTVPKDFGSQELTWTLTANGMTTSVPLNLKPLWEIEPFKDATDNTPPVLQLDHAARVQGPKPLTVAVTASPSAPLPLTVFASDDAKLVPGMQKPKTPPVTLTWSKYRGPGSVTFANPRPPVEKTEDSAEGAAFTGKASTTATFSEPGEYMLYLVANDWTGKGGRGFQCCWTNALVKVSVK